MCRKRRKVSLLQWNKKSLEGMRQKWHHGDMPLENYYWDVFVLQKLRYYLKAQKLNFLLAWWLLPGFLSCVIKCQFSTIHAYKKFKYGVGIFKQNLFHICSSIDQNKLFHWAKDMIFGWLFFAIHSINSEEFYFNSNKICSVD